MTRQHLPRSYYLRRAVACYERVGDAYAAAEVLAEGELTDITEAARRFAALGDLPAAGEAYLAAAQPRPALDCFRRAGLRDGELRCLLALGDDAQAGMLLLDMQRPAEAHPHLARALAAVSDATLRATLGLHLSRALLLSGQHEQGTRHYTEALAGLQRLPEVVASVEAWAALGAWGHATGRQDRMQEGYAQALRLLEHEDRREQWEVLARHYRDAAHHCDNRRLVQVLDAQLAAAAPPPPITTTPPDPVPALLHERKWHEAFALLEQRTAEGVHAHTTTTTTVLLACLVESGGAPLPLRVQAAALLGSLGDPRLLDVESGDSLLSGMGSVAGIRSDERPPTLAGYWCHIEGGPFWFGDERKEALRQVVLPYAFAIGRYPITRGEYERFCADGGYTTRAWWSEYGWQQCLEEDWHAPRYFDDGEAQPPNQPVTCISWYEAMAYCAWLTAQGHNAGWLPPDSVLRLPTSLEWERAIRHTDQRRYPWGDTEPDSERANYDESGIQGLTPVGCFPGGAAVCGALDMTGNLQEALATTTDAPAAWEPLHDVAPFQPVLRSHGDFRDQKALLSCGYRGWFYPASADGDRGFRLVWAPQS
jgi:formylglycine-generating enzyme required for sulfatase activity